MSLLINAFEGGWQNKARHERMKDDAVYMIKDISFHITGRLTCRDLHGRNSYFSSMSYTEPISNVFQVDVEGRNKRLIYYTVGNTLYCWNSVTNDTRIISSNITPGTHFSYTALKPELSDYTYIFMTDGISMLSDNGTSTKTWGIDPPNGVPTVGLSAESGYLTVGSYRYVYTFYDANTGTESDPSPASASFSVNNNEAILVSDIQTSDNERVTSRRLYRTLADGGSYYLVATIPDNVTTSFTDRMADSELSVKATTDQGVPPIGDIVVTYMNIILLSGDPNYPNRLYFSIPTKPDNFPSSYYVDVGTSDDRIVNLVKFSNTVFIIKEGGIERLYGTDPDSFISYPTRSDVGTYARWSAAVGTDGIYFLGYDGIYRFNGERSVKISTAIDSIFGKKPDSLYDIIDKDSAGDIARGCFLNGVYYLLVPMKSVDGSVENKIIAFNTVDNVWNLFDINANYITADQGRGILYGCMSDLENDGFYTVYELMSESSSSFDDPNPMFVTKSFDIRNIGDYSTETKQVGGGIVVKGNQDIGWLREFRVDGKGDWKFEFYLDRELRHTRTITGLNNSNINTWYDFEPKLKGRYLYIKATAQGTKQPDSCYINEIEVK